MNFYILFMVICSLNALEKLSEKKETKIKKEQLRCYIKLVTIERDQNDEILGFDLLFIGQNNTDFNSSSATIGYFQKVSFQGCNLNFELPSAFMYASCELFDKQAVLCGNNSILLKIRDSLFCVTNRCINVTSKKIMATVSTLNFVLLRRVE